MNQSYDEFLVRCLSEYKDAEFADVPAEEDIHHEFSEKYLKQKKKLIKKVGSSYWHYVNTAAKKAAVITVSVVLALASLMSVEAVRKTALDFFYQIYHDHIEIIGESPRNDRQVIETCYSIKNVPEGYEICYKEKLEIFSTIVWKESDGKAIYFTQYLSSDGALHSVNDEAQTKEVTVNGTNCLQVIAEGNYQYHWEYDGYTFAVIYPEELGEDYAGSVVGKLVETQIQ